MVVRDSCGDRSEDCLSAENEGAMKTQIVSVVGILVLAAIYFVAAKFGLSLAYVHVSASLIWPASESHWRRC